MTLNEIKKYLHTNGMKKMVLEDLVFFVNDRLASQPLRESLLFLDDIISEIPVVKDSRTTTAGILELEDGQRVFIKRENNKGFVFTLKYLLRHSRVFRAAVAAKKLEELEVPTPEIIAVGSRRKNGVLKSGYLITETLDNVLNLGTLCQKLNTEPEFYDEFFDTVCRYISILHNHGIVHGDLKLSNIYCMETTKGYNFGLWDLDGTHQYSHSLSRPQRAYEAGRVISSYARVSWERFQHKVPLEKAVTDFLKKYQQYADQIPSEAQVKSEINTFLKRHNIKL